MNEQLDVLEAFVAGLRSRVKSIPFQIMVKESDRIVLQVGSNTEAVMVLNVCDPDKPSFNVSYPKLKIKKDGEQRTQEVESKDCLDAGAEWIFEQLAKYGAVVPEYFEKGDKLARRTSRH